MTGAAQHEALPNKAPLGYGPHGVPGNWLMCFSKPDAAMMSQREQVAIQQGNSSNYHGGRVCVCVAGEQLWRESCKRKTFMHIRAYNKCSCCKKSVNGGGKSSGYSQSSTQAQTRLGVRGVRGVSGSTNEVIVSKWWLGERQYWPGWLPPSCSPSCWRWRWLCASALKETCPAGRTETGQSDRPCTGHRWGRVWSGPWSCWCSWWWLTGRCLQLENTVGKKGTICTKWTIPFSQRKDRTFHDACVDNLQNWTSFTK